LGPRVAITQFVPDYVPIFTWIVANCVWRGIRHTPEIEGRLIHMCNGKQRKKKQW
jgi:hypothetical protein